MSDYGLLLKNDNGEIQIDSTYRNFAKSEEDSSVTITNGNTEATYKTVVDIVDSPLAPVILFRPNTDDFSCIIGLNKPASNYISFYMSTTYDQSTIIDWKSYAESSSPSSAIYGLEVFNSAGNLCFDSEKSYFKAYSAHSITLGSPSDYYDITHSGISNPFYLLSPSSLWVVVESDGDFIQYNWYKVGLKKLSSTSVRVGWFKIAYSIISGSTSDVSEGYNPTLTLLVCDTT